VGGRQGCDLRGCGPGELFGVTNGRITKTESLSKKFRADHLASCVGRVDMVLVSAFFMVIAP